MAILFSILFIVLIISAFFFYVSFINKIDLVKDKFRMLSRDFYQIAEKGYGVKTNGKKIRTWNIDHAKDYIINQNCESLKQAIETYATLKKWWINKYPNALKDCITYIELLSNKMFLFRSSFREKATRELYKLVDLYNPQKLEIKLYTYTCYENGEAHYSPDLKAVIYSQSAVPRISSVFYISPEELISRMNFLSKFDYTITKHQYDMSNQRALITPELRLKIMKRDSYTCQICHKLCTPNEIEIDHIIPVSKGGKSIESNLQVLCASCNRKKGNKLLVQSNKAQNETNEELDGSRINEQKTALNTEKVQNNVVQNKTIRWAHVVSSNVSLTYYNTHTNSLYVRFKNGSIYKYLCVPSSIYLEFLRAESKGKFVRNVLYSFKYTPVDIDEVE